MDAKEAIEKIKMRITDVYITCMEAGLSEDAAIKRVEHLNLAVDALELQVKKLPKGISLTHEGRVGNCPKCNVLVRENLGRKTCDCGQQIVWWKEQIA